MPSDQPVFLDFWVHYHRWITVAKARHFSLRALLVAMLVVAAFFAGVRFERERRRREDKAMVPMGPPPNTDVIDADYWPTVQESDEGNAK